MTPVTPSELLLPAVTDVDGSEALETLELIIEGLPAGADAPSLGFVPPPGAGVSFDTDPATGATTLTLTLTAAASGDVLAAYQSLALFLPADFSTANRSDLTGSATTLPLTLTLNVQTDEDQDPNSDTPIDGTATATRQVEIDATEDITLDAPQLLLTAEDDGVPNSDQGVDVDLQIEIDITDQDGSETADTADPRFAATVRIDFAGLPVATTASTGALDVAAGLWTGSVAEAEALILSLPGDYNGAILHAITVITPEGTESRLQTIITLPTPDIVIDGTVITAETDAPVEVLLSDFISVLVTDPNEAVEELSFSLPGLPPGTEARDADGNPVGTFTPAGDGTVGYALTLAASDPTDPAGIRLILPTDYSTENPATTLTAALTVTTTDGTASGDIPVIVTVEGDVQVDDATLALTETDAPVRFTPANSVLPAVTDADGSESIIGVAVAFNALPPGTRISLDGGTSFTDLTQPTLNFIGTLAEYQALVIELPTDFSTENPATTLFAEIGAISDEGGSGVARLDVTVGFETDLVLTAPADLTAAEDGDGFDGGGVTVDLDISAMATDADGSEDSATVSIQFIGLPPGTTASIGTLDVNAGTWTGTMGQANALSLTFPGDYSGTVTSTITLAGPEGQITTDQTLTITPTGDVDLDIDELTAAETDARVVVTPSTAWSASISDSDPGLPAETLDTLTLTLVSSPSPQTIPPKAPMRPAPRCAGTGRARRHHQL